MPSTPARTARAIGIRAIKQPVADGYANGITDRPRKTADGVGSVWDDQNSGLGDGTKT